LTYISVLSIVGYFVALSCYISVAYTYFRCTHCTSLEIILDEMATSVKRQYCVRTSILHLTKYCFRFWVCVMHCSCKPLDINTLLCLVNSEALRHGTIQITSSVDNKAEDALPQ
jgi:hypothetical protein